MATTTKTREDRARAFLAWVETRFHQIQGDAVDDDGDDDTDSSADDDPITISEAAKAACRALVAEKFRTKPRFVGANICLGGTPGGLTLHIYTPDRHHLKYEIAPDGTVPEPTKTYLTPSTTVAMPTTTELPPALEADFECVDEDQDDANENNLE